MIKIIKPLTPAILTTDGAMRAAQHCSAYSANPSLFQTRAGKFTFDRAIYAHQDVKRALQRAQRRKCCFCESKIGREGQVEHFRPKAASQQSKGSKLIRPGYYWLAYDWDNLFLSCYECNTLYKRYLFPLSNPTKRAFHHGISCTIEIPLLIHPSHDNPEDFISFRKDVPYPLVNPKGRRTIDVLKLDRDELNEARREKLNQLLTYRDMVSLEKFLPTDANTQRRLRYMKRVLATCAKPNSAFASMAKANGFR